MKAATLYARLTNHKWVAVNFTSQGIPLPPKDCAYFAIRASKPNAEGKRPYIRQESLDAAMVALAQFNANGTRPAVESPAPIAPDAQFALALENANRVLSQSASIADKAEQWLTYVQGNRARKTWLAYQNTVRKFFLPYLDSRNVKALAEITGPVVHDFKKYLEPKVSERSVYNHFLNVMSFLKWAEVKTGIKTEDWPDKPERDPEEYTEEEVRLLLKNVRNEEERLLLESLLCSGFRSGEMAHLTYGDIDFAHSVWRVWPKNGQDNKGRAWHFEPKTEAGKRRVPVPESLTKKILERMKQLSRKRQDLIFPDSTGGPDGHLLRVVQRAAEKAGLTEIRVDDHKFRSTAITRWLRAGYATTDVIVFAGHGNMDTLKRYAAKVNLEKPENRIKAEQAFEFVSRRTA